MEGRSFGDGGEGGEYGMNVAALAEGVGYGTVRKLGVGLLELEQLTDRRRVRCEGAQPVLSRDILRSKRGMTIVNRQPFSFQSTEVKGVKFKIASVRGGSRSGKVRKGWTEGRRTKV